MAKLAKDSENVVGGKRENDGVARDPDLPIGGAGCIGCATPRLWLVDCIVIGSEHHNASL